jgi:hypothetical protein
VERLERRIQKQLVALPISLRRLMAGGVAGAVSKSATAPLETLKMQLVQAGSTTAWQAATATWRRGGVLAFFRCRVEQRIYFVLCVPLTSLA